MEPETAEFPLRDLLHWLRTASLRWGGDITSPRWGDNLTARLEDTRLNIYQDGTYRAAIDLADERPFLGNWADDDA